MRLGVLGCRAELGLCQPSPVAPRVEVVHGRVGALGQQKSQELDFSLLSLTMAAQGEALISQAAERLGVSPGTGETDFKISGRLAEDWCPSTLALALWHSRVSWG